MGQRVFKIAAYSTDKEDVAASTTVGTETLDATFAAGEIGIVFDDAVDFERSRELTYIINRLADVAREKDYATS